MYKPCLPQSECPVMDPVFETGSPANVQGRFLGIFGGRSSVSQLSVEFAARLQDSRRVYFIDAGNVFSVALINRIFGSRTSAILTRIQIARPFTIYQLRDIVFSIEKSVAKESFIIISPLNTLLADTAIKEKEREALLNSIFSHLRFVSGERSILTYLFIARNTVNETVLSDNNMRMLDNVYDSI